MLELFVGSDSGDDDDFGSSIKLVSSFKKSYSSSSSTSNSEIGLLWYFELLDQDDSGLSK